MKTIKKISNLIENFSNSILSTSFAECIRVYSDVLYWCDPQYGKKCNSIINDRANYIGFSFSTIFVCKELAKNYLDKNKKPYLNQFEIAFNGFVNIAGMHAFYMHFMLFLYTEYKMNNGSESDEVGISDSSFAMISISCALLAILSHDALRELFFKKINSLLCNNRYSYENLFMKIFNFILQLIMGFATGRGFVASIEDIVAISSQSNVIYTKGGRVARYTFGSIWGIANAVSKWIDPQKYPSFIIVENTPRHYRFLIDKMIARLSHAFIIFIFTWSTFAVFEADYDLNKKLQTAWISLLFFILMMNEICKKTDEQAEDYTIVEDEFNDDDEKKSVNQARHESSSLEESLIPSDSPSSDLSSTTISQADPHFSNPTPISKQNMFKEKLNKILSLRVMNASNENSSYESSSSDRSIQSAKLP